MQIAQTDSEREAGDNRSFFIFSLFLSAFVYLLLSLFPLSPLFSTPSSLSLISFHTCNKQQQTPLADRCLVATTASNIAH